jgi:hypothetical protein
MAIVLNSSGNLPENHECKVFALFRMAVDDDQELLTYPYRGTKICLAGADSNEVRAKAHLLIDTLFDGFDKQVKKVEVPCENTELPTVSVKDEEK